MEKYALFEIGTTYLRMTLAVGEQGEYFHIYKTLSEPVNINRHIEADGMIKSSKIYECVSIIKMYKKICIAEGVTHFFAVASNTLIDAKNSKTFIDELGGTLGQEFKILTNEIETNAIYSAVVNTLDVSKGIIVNISGFSTRIIHYSRRMILNSVTIPYGSVSLFEKTGNMSLIATDVFRKELEKNAPFFLELDPETQIVGVSDVFTSFGKIVRKMKKYPFDVENNYVTDSEAFTQVFEFIKTLDMDRKQKLKGISSESAQTILCGMCIVDAILKYSKLKKLVIATAYRNVGILQNAILPYTVDKPITDLLGYSLNVIEHMSGQDVKHCEHFYELAILLFKQIRVLHKLPRMYAKILRIASHLYSLNKFVNSYYAILAAPIMGATHREIVLAAFAASFKKWEDFNLAEWIKYKDMVTDEDLEAVRKLSMILAMTEALDVRGGNEIKDINCDLLGDSVILKLLTSTEQHAPKIDSNAADVEIFQAKKYAAEFQKTFKRALELL